MPLAAKRNERAQNKERPEQYSLSSLERYLLPQRVIRCAIARTTRTIAGASAINRLERILSLLRSRLHYSVTWSLLRDMRSYTRANPSINSSVLSLKRLEVLQAVSQRDGRAQFLSFCLCRFTQERRSLLSRTDSKQHCVDSINARPILYMYCDW